MDEHYSSSNVGWVSVFLRNPPGVAQQHNAFIIVCLPAHPVDHGTHGVPHPPYVEGGTAQVIVIRN